MHTHTLLLLLLLLLLLKPGVCESCSLVVSPAGLVVKYGAPASANCTSDTVTFMGWESSQGESQVFSPGVKELTWRVDSLTDWNIKPQCFEMSEEGGQCARVLNVTVYKLPDRVSIRYLSHSGPVVEGHQYSLHCVVQNIAPIEHLRVTFFKVSTNGEQTVLYTQPLNNDIQQRNNGIREPVNESFSLQFSPTSVDDGAQLWCSAMLDLGPEGPQPPPVMESDHLNINVHFAPEFSCSAKLQVRAGEGLTCDVRGNPLPSVTWLRDGQVLTPPTHLSREDAGDYTLMALNRIGKANHTVEVEVLHGPAARGASCQAAGSATVAVLLLQLIHWL
ncbi:vascular cell adhesion protein 1-like [Salvelinus fontinalis]|uniref:vascular cell adhesion protein 1-like n=1 Tax=Salvelinus fontinalis TaxID=8038 RepID=UPI002486A85A|nr:vascular cell adhesion protein 1-like [Salvelinus fontinalis]